jgi:ATP sulfurylase
METDLVSESTLVTPHGGTLVDRLVSAADAAAFAAHAATLAPLPLDAREQADLELIATGAASPLTGFLGKADYDSVLDRLRLADGTVWPLPFTLAVADDVPVAFGEERSLVDAGGRTWGTILVTEIFTRDPNAESRAVYGTDDPAHPGVAYLLNRPTRLIAGPVKVLPLPADLPFAEYRFTPRQLRERIGALGWKRVAGFQTRNPIHRAHEHLTKLALEVSDGLVIHPLVGETKQDDVPAAVRFKAYEALVAKYYPKDRTVLAAFPAAMRYAGPREALFHAIARKNYGINQLIVGRDHAGVGKYYEPLAAQRIFDRFEPNDLGVTPLRLDPTFYCRACGTLASSKSCPHDASTRLELSGSKVREILRAGGHLPEEFSRPEVAEVLRAAYIAASGALPADGAAPATAEQATKSADRAFILWFTGLSGAGKSTLAEALKPRLERRTVACRFSTATKCGRICRKASASPRKTATPTSAASASSRASSRATASSPSARRFRPMRPRATKCARPRRKTASSSSRCTRTRRSTRSQPATSKASTRKRSPERSATSRASRIRTKRRPTPTCRFAATRNRWTRAWRAFSASSRRAGWSISPRWRGCRL